MSLNEIASNPYVQLSGWIVGIGSFIYAIWTNYTNKRDKRPKYTYKSFALIEGLSSKIPELKITYSGHSKELTHFAITKVFFWNAGRKTIHKDDIPKSAPLKIHIPQYSTILDAKVLYPPDQTNNIKIVTNRDHDHVTLTFDHLDYQEGAVIQIVHDAFCWKEIRMSGKVIGGGEPMLATIEEFTKISRAYLSAQLLLAVSTTVIVSLKSIHPDNFYLSTATGIVLCMFFIFGLYSYRQSRLYFMPPKMRRYAKSFIDEPKEN